MSKQLTTVCMLLLCLSAVAALGASTPDTLADVVELPPGPSVRLRQSGTVSFPIEISLDEIQALLNEKVPGTFEKKQARSLGPVVKGGWMEYKIERGPIALTPLNTPDGDVLGFAVPMKGEVATGGKLLKIMPASAGVEFRGTLIGSIRAGLNPDWTPDVQTAFAADLDKGNLKILRTFQIKIRDHLEDELQDRRPELEKKLMKQLDLLDLPRRIQPYWAQLYKTIRLSRNPPAWIQFKPRSLALGSLTLSKDRRMLLDVQVETEAVTFLGEKPPDQEPEPLPRLGRARETASAFKMSVPSYISLSAVGQFLEKQFLPVSFDVNPQISVTFRKLAFDGDGARVKCSIQAEARGGVFGSGLPVTLNTTMTPMLDPEKRELRFENLKYTLETETLLAKSASVLLEPVVLAKLQEKARFSFGDLLERARDKVNQIMDGKRANKHVEVSAYFDKMDVRDLFLRDGQIVIVSSAEGALRLKIHP